MVRRVGWSGCGSSPTVLQSRMGVIFELVVTDDKDTESAPVEVTITIESTIAVPVANAGADQNVTTQVSHKGNTKKCG